jgi:hypothetical protein
LNFDRGPDIFGQKYPARSCQAATKPRSFVVMAIFRMKYALVYLFITMINVVIAGRFSVPGGHRIPTTVHRRNPVLTLRGGFDAVRCVSRQHELSPTSIPENKVLLSDIDCNLLEGDIARLSQGQVVREEDYEHMAENAEDASYQFHMTQQFLVLQNARIESQLPGGSNCSYADSWFTGEMWDKSDDDTKWSRSAWIQCQQAENWEEMPPVWKRIMKESWEELQEFMALLTLPDGGESTAKFRAHEEAWEVCPKHP